MGRGEYPRHSSEQSHLFADDVAGWQMDSTFFGFGLDSSSTGPGVTFRTGVSISLNISGSPECCPATPPASEAPVQRRLAQRVPVSVRPDASADSPTRLLTNSRAIAASRSSSASSK